MKPNADKTNDKIKPANGKPAPAPETPAEPEELPLDLQLLDFWDKNKKLVITGACVVVAGVAVYLAVDRWLEQKRETEGRALMSAKVDKDFAAVASQFKGENTGAFALLLLADQQYQDGKYSDAEKTYQRFADEYPKHPMLDAAFYGKGAARESQGDYAGAINAYQRVTETPNASHMLDARMAVGRCLEAQQQWKKARQNYEDLIAASPNSQWAERARNRIIALDREARARGETLTPQAAKPAGAPTAIPQVLLPATPATPVTPAAKPPAPAPVKK
ncbi:MAG: tetratricopeptide repeat protein [Verrucomicrobia bacterium]|nr:tetratricopeptide repeat protein [Verrucomicrobiota bacterium]